MRRPRALVLALAAASLAAAACGAGRSATVDNGDAVPRPPTPVRWASLGDSFASAEGLAGARADCAQSTEAFANVAAARLSAEVPVATVAHVACTGARIADIDAQLREAAKSLPAGERFNLATVTIGGNDAEFGLTLLDCMGADDLVREAVTVALGRTPRGCDVDPVTMAERVRDLEPRLEALYQRIVDALAPRGRLVVLTYPDLFADPDDWPVGDRRCDGISAPDAANLRDAGVALRDTLEAAAAKVERVDIVDVAPVFVGHERCGTGEAWLHGVTLGVSIRTFRVQGSFHPNADGHAAEADLLLDHLFAIYRVTD